MIRPTYLYIILVCIHFSTFSQDKEDISKLAQEVEKTNDKIYKLQLLDSLSKKVYEFYRTDFDFYKQNYPKYCLQYINLAKEIDSIDLASAKTARFSNHYLNFVEKPDSALVILNKIIGDSNKIKNKINLGHLYLKRAGSYYQADSLQTAVKDYERAQNIYHYTKDSIYEADALLFCGQANERLGNLTNAILKYQFADRLYTKLKDTSYMAYSKIYVASIFSQLYLVDESISEREKARVLLDKQKNKDYTALAELYVNDARDYVKKKEFDKEEKAYLKAIELMKKNPSGIDQNFIIRAYMSYFYSKHDQTEVAQKYIDTLELSKDLVTGIFSRPFYLRALGKLKMMQGKYDEAIPVFEEDLKIRKASNDLQSQRGIEKELYLAYKSSNNLKEALPHLERHELLKDSLYNIARSNSLIYYKTLYETEKKENQIVVQKADIQYLETKNEARRKMLVFGGIGLSLLFITAYLYRNRVLLLRNRKMQQSFLQELLQTQERVSKRISKDLHDSVGQSLLIIKNKLIQNKDKQTADIVDNVIDEVREISRSLHPFKLEEMGLTVTIQSSVEMIDENYDIFISAEIDDIDSVFGPEQEINIYRLIQESFNNIVKHSNAKSAEIKVLNKADNVEIVITDNGKGFDVGAEKVVPTKIGLKTLSERSKFLKATFRILSEINQGTTLIFNIPKHA